MRWSITFHHGLVNFEGELAPLAKQPAFPSRFVSCDRQTRDGHGSLFLRPAQATSLQTQPIVAAHGSTQPTHSTAMQIGVGLYTYMLFLIISRLQPEIIIAHFQRFWNSCHNKQ